MTETRKKITLYNQHFAYITKNRYEKLANSKNVTDISEYVRRKAKQQFKLSIQNAQDVEELSKKIKVADYESNTEWLKDKIREDLKERPFKYYIDEMLCLDEIQNSEDIAMAKEAGYKNVCYTASEFKKRFPEMDTAKVFFDNVPYLSHTVYYDEDKHSMIEMTGGYPIGCTDFSFSNFKFMIHPNFSGSTGEYYLKAINEVYASFCTEQYDLFTFQNMQFYRNEILEKIITSTEDDELKKILKDCQNNEN